MKIVHTMSKTLEVKQRRRREYAARNMDARTKAAKARQTSAFVPVKLNAQALVKVTEATQQRGVDALCRRDLGHR